MKKIRKVIKTGNTTLKGTKKKSAAKKNEKKTEKKVSKKNTKSTVSLERLDNFPKGKVFFDDDINQKQLEIAEFLNSNCHGRTHKVWYQPKTLALNNRLTIFSGPLNKDIQFYITFQMNVNGKMDNNGNSVNGYWWYSILFNGVSQANPESEFQVRQALIGANLNRPIVTDEIDTSLMLTCKKDQNLTMDFLIDRIFYDRGSQGFLYLDNLTVILEVFR